MKNTYLLEVIKALQPNERQEMALFLASAASQGGGNAKEMAHLYQIILNAAPDFPDALLQKEEIYFRLFSDQSIVQGKLDKLMSDLNKFLRNHALSKDYLAESNEAQRQVDWAAWLRKRGLSERAQRVLAKLKNQEEMEKTESLERFRVKLLIAEEGHEWESKYNQLKGDLEIPNLISALDLYYNNYRTELANRYLLQQKATKLTDWGIVEQELSEKQGVSILLGISKKIFDVLRKEFPSVAETQHLMELLRKNETSLSFQAFDYFYAYLRNSCTLLINSGNLEFIPILHEIHKENLEQGYLYIHGEIPPTSYLNLVQVATRAKAYKWAKKFTEDYKRQIVGGDEGGFFYRLNMARCLFSEGNFEQALDYIPDTPSSSHYHHVVRMLELKIYYELRSELLQYKTDTFRKFIDRTEPKTIAANLRVMDLNFLNLLLQLTQIPFKDKARSDRLVARIESKKLVSERSWLLEKARELG